MRFVLIFPSIIWLLSSIETLGQESNKFKNHVISILTVSPSTKEITSAFGHCAVRIYNPDTKSDIVYSYGVFNPAQKGYLFQFLKGHPDYSLDRGSFDMFLLGYFRDGREIQEHVLTLSSIQKKSIIEYLQWNILPANSRYKYDYLSNNCATKIVALLREQGQVELASVPLGQNAQSSFRSLIHQYTVDFPWGQLFIDVTLGSPLDKKVDPIDAMFLPRYFRLSLESTNVLDNGKKIPIVKSKKILVEGRVNVSKSPKRFTPFLTFFILLVVSVSVSIYEFKKGIITHWLDFILLLLTGFLGICLVFLWWKSRHVTSAYNFNLLWALPTNLIVAFLIFRPVREVIVTYFSVAIFFIFILIIIDRKAVQDINSAFIPLILSMIYRYACNMLFYLKQKT